SGSGPRSRHVRIRHHEVPAQVPAGAPRRSRVAAPGPRRLVGQDGGRARAGAFDAPCAQSRRQRAHVRPGSIGWRRRVHVRSRRQHRQQAEVLMSGHISNVRPKPDKVLTLIADYATKYSIKSDEAYETARYCLMDTLGCGLEALEYPACTKLL